MDHSDKPDSQPKLLNPGTVAKLENLSPAARANVLDVASRILARHLKFRSRDTPYPVTEEMVSTTAGPENQGTWTPPPTYLKE
jgi:hypothetical protein